MHLLESASSRFQCIPVVHEVAAGIAAEYFNETSPDGTRAFALVTAGPGLTNIVTALAGAFLESRELLVIGGQAKTSDLSRGTVPQIGHQEIDGISIVKSITVHQILADRRLRKQEVLRAIYTSRQDRKGPVFIEMCIDVSAMPPLENEIHTTPEVRSAKIPCQDSINYIRERWQSSQRPVLLLGGGLDRGQARHLVPKLMELKIPIATTWNGFDRIGSDYEFYCGRPNTYGMRWANILIQSADFILALGTRLGVQQVGFSWEEFAPSAKVIQVDVDELELLKGFPRIDLGVSADANSTLCEVLNNWQPPTINQEWASFIMRIRGCLSGPDKANIANDGFVELHKFVYELSDYLKNEDIIIPCSSGGTFNAVMQMFRQTDTQKCVTDKGLASMGYGLSGAIGAGVANPNNRIVLLEGDGGFAQNLQELGTVDVLALNLKIFLMSNRGYASIRTTQKSYFNGNYIGCDRKTGLGLPEWPLLATAFHIPYFTVTAHNLWSSEMLHLMNSVGPTLFVVELDPEQLFYPKVTSRVLENGSMKTNPIHVMSPDLETETKEEFFKYIPRSMWY